MARRCVFQHTDGPPVRAFHWTDAGDTRIDSVLALPGDLLDSRNAVFENRGVVQRIPNHLGSHRKLMGTFELHVSFVSLPQFLPASTQCAQGNRALADLSSRPTIG